MSNLKEYRSIKASFCEAAIFACSEASCGLWRNGNMVLEGPKVVLGDVYPRPLLAQTAAMANGWRGSYGEKTGCGSHLQARQFMTQSGRLRNRQGVARDR